MNQTAVPDTRRRYLELAWVLAVLLLVLGIATAMHPILMTQQFDPNGYENVGVPTFWFFLSVPLTALAPPLALRRPWLAVLAATVLPIGSLIFGVSLFSAFAGIVATGLVLLQRSTLTGFVVASVSLLIPLDLVGGGTMLVPDGSQIYAGYWDGSRSGILLLLYAVAVLAALVAGLGYRSWAGNAEAQARLDAERSALGNRSALVGERSRLARDLHDVVAHHVSLIAVRAETAPYTVPDLQPAARVVLSEIAEDSRKALDELRGVLGRPASRRGRARSRAAAHWRRHRPAGGEGAGDRIRDVRGRRAPGGAAGDGRLRRLPRRAGGAHQRSSARAGRGGVGGGYRQ